MTKEQKFYNALTDVFIGAKVEGESGYSNLTRIKSRYYEKGVFPKLNGDIEKALNPFPHFREELFDKLYTTQKVIAHECLFVMPEVFSRASMYSKDWIPA
jgi:hypothetical protein